MIREWCDEHPEGEELTHGGWGHYDHGWWLNLSQWGLGVEVVRDYGSHSWPNRRTFIVTVGPFAWAATKEWEVDRGE